MSLQRLLTTPFCRESSRCIHSAVSAGEAKDSSRFGSSLWSSRRFYMKHRADPHILQVAPRLLRLSQSIVVQLHTRRVVVQQTEHAEVVAGVLFQQRVDGDEVLQRLRHLPALDEATWQRREKRTCDRREACGRTIARRNRLRTGRSRCSGGENADRFRPHASTSHREKATTSKCLPNSE